MLPHLLGIALIVFIVHEISKGERIESDYKSRLWTNSPKNVPFRSASFIGKDKQSIPEMASVMANTAFIVEDNKDSAEALKIWLELHGFKVADYQDFETALGHIQQDNPCIIFMDLHVPGEIDAKTFIRKVREAHPSIVIVVVSGRHDVQNFAHEVGAVWLTKPYNPDTVRMLATRYCERQTGSSV
jgi:two-component system, response regulator PdtaR